MAIKGSGGGEQGHHRRGDTKRDGSQSSIIPVGLVGGTYHLSPVSPITYDITYHPSPVTDHLSLVTYHLSSITYHLSLTTYHLSPITYHLSSPITYHLSCFCFEFESAREVFDFVATPLFCGVFGFVVLFFSFFVCLTPVRGARHSNLTIAVHDLRRRRKSSIIFF